MSLLDDMLTQTKPSKERVATYGMRPDKKTPKGAGYFGEIAATNPELKKRGQFSGELTIGVNIDGQDMDIPSMVPTLSRTELKSIVNGGPMTDSIVNKAVDHAKKRLKEGKSVYAEPGEFHPLPAE